MKRVVTRSLLGLDTSPSRQILKQNGLLVHQFIISMSLHSSAFQCINPKQQMGSLRHANNFNHITTYYIHYNAKRNESTTSEDKITQTALNTENNEDDCQQKENDGELSEFEGETNQSVRFEINFQNHNIYYAFSFALLLLIPSLNHIISTFIDEFIIGNDAMNERRSFYWNNFKITSLNTNNTNLQIIINQIYSFYHYCSFDQF